MRILQIASEVASVAKVGGLGDVLMGLSRQLLSYGHNVQIVLPKYGCISYERLKSTGKTDRFRTYFNGEKEGTATYFLLDSSIPVVLFDTEDGYFSAKKSVYGEGDDTAYFLSFVRMVVEWMQQIDEKWDAVHCHDWPGAIFPQLYQVLSRKKADFTTVFTIHNFQYQGWCSKESFLQAGLYPHDFEEVFSGHDYGNLLKAGLQYANWVTTVSPGYAKEMIEDRSDAHLHALLHDLNGRFVGILNGVDYTFWDPKNDPYIQERYGIDDPDQMSVTKAKNKKMLLASVSLQSEKELPLVVFITRLVSQKGVNIIADILLRAEKIPAQFLLVGSVPDPVVRSQFEDIDRFLREKNKGAVLLCNDEKIAHQAYASADYIMVPSVYEPCGLTQLIGCKYGVIPIVRKTGGLADTIIDVAEDPISGNGFVFIEMESEAALKALCRALKLSNDTIARKNLVEKCMRANFGWKNSALRYIELYSDKIT